jgi:hypothetical protein
VPTGAPKHAAQNNQAVYAVLWLRVQPPVLFKTYSIETLNPLAFGSTGLVPTFARDGMQALLHGMLWSNKSIYLTLEEKLIISCFLVGSMSLYLLQWAASLMLRMSLVRLLNLKLADSRTG